MKKTVLIFTGFLFLTPLAIFSKERPIVKDIQASSGKGTKINVTWLLPEDPSTEITKLFVFRSVNPIGSYYDLNDKEPVAELQPDFSNYIDTVKDYRDYYYAVICETEGRKFDIILPSINSTVNGVHLKLPEKQADTETAGIKKEKPYSIESLRDTPLPYLDILDGRNRTPLKMSEEAVAIARELAVTTKLEKNIITEPYVFEEDLISPDSGDDFLLFEILRTTFIQKKYRNAQEQLDKLIRSNRTKSVTNRAIFYLAESYYFTKNYQEATTTFLSVYDEYPALAKRWINSSLDLLELPED